MNIFDALFDRGNGEKLIQPEKQQGPRNGPVKIRHMTNGQVRRAQKRAQETAARKNRKRQVRAFHRGQFEEASLRGRLQVVAHNQGKTYPVALQENALFSLVSEYAEAGKYLDSNGDVAIDARACIDEAAATYGRLQAAKRQEAARRRKAVA